jgi:DNA-binding NarL/FixJ family response regulator
VNKIRVFVAEDHETVRHGLKLVIGAQPDMEVVGEAATGRTAAARIPQVHPDVVLMDISMPDMNGLQATQALREQNPTVPIVALTRYSDEAYVKEMLHAGASGYVLKQSASDELVRAIRAAAAGQRYLDPALEKAGRRYLTPRSGRSPKVPELTEREVEVLRRMARGYSNKDIAADLDISVKTVEVHKANAMRKLGLRGRIDIVRYAVLQGWLQDT